MNSDDAVMTTRIGEGERRISLDLPVTMHAFHSGAKSTVEKPRYDLIPRQALSAIANRLGYGVARHGENNWKKGASDPAFIRDRKNHAIEHLINYANGVRGGEVSVYAQLEAAITNLAMLCALEQPDA